MLNLRTVSLSLSEVVRYSTFDGVGRVLSFLRALDIQSSTVFYFYVNKCYK